MAYQVLARKWRPKRFEEVVGQTHITTSIQNALLNKKVAHAYLMTGTRGVGKTSVARLLAKALRCEKQGLDANPCLKCESCLDVERDSSVDVMEMDGASNNSVENIRQIVDNVQYLPATGKYKIYIIDEVHMLSNSAFNAILKTLEEPPAHVVFILATTEAEKLPSTILSRCQRFDFRHISLQELTEHLQIICDKENIILAQKDILKRLANQGKGSVRDSLSLLDQVLSFCVENKITEEALVVALGIAKTQAIQDLLKALLMGNTKASSEVYRQMLQENVEIKNIALALLDELFEMIQGLDKLKNKEELKDISSAEIFWIYETLAKDLEWSIRSLDPEKVTEIVLQKISLRREFLGEEVKKKSKNIEEITPTANLLSSPQKNWPDFLNFLNNDSPLLASHLEQGNVIGNPLFSEQGVAVEVAFTKESKLFFEYLQEGDSRQKISDKLAHFFNLESPKVKLKIIYLSDEEKQKIGFQSKVEMDKMKIQKEQGKIKEEILNHPRLKDLESLFDAKVEEIIFNE
ncbi:MAG: DNA polymerase III subunit gamma/tau [Bacteriovoracaceae bacterium]|nr:DNA polymerase III subunit gamma/tau [Bacteriovoracaceae bacterium]